jgi:hypothetical protein
VQPTLKRARRRIYRKSAIKHTTPVIQCNRALVNSVATGLILEIGLGFVLRFLGILGAFRVFLNSINRLVNTELQRGFWRRIGGYF